MSLDKIIFASIVWLCALIFGVIALWANKRQDPMHFWSGSTVKPEEITDIPAYNRANSLMWGIYALCMVAAGILSFFSLVVGVIILLILCLPGLAVLVVVYRRIYKKYRNPNFDSTSSAKRAKTPKSVIIITLITIMLTFAGVGALFFYGEKEPEVRILENSIQIKAQYGLNIDFSEIADITLIDKSMRELGVGRRTNGYASGGGTLKGNFKSETLGETLLFVEADSSPTIKIDRVDKKDIYISYRHREKTEQLFRELRANTPFK